MKSAPTEKTFSALKEALAIAERLYRSDRDRYKPVFEFIHSSARRREPMEAILTAVRSLDLRESGAGEIKANPVSDVRQYLGGALRRLKNEREARDLRATRGGEDFLKQFTETMIAAADRVAERAEKRRPKNNRGKLL